MNKKKISQLPAASALTGAELVEIVQSGFNKKTTTQDIVNLTPSGQKKEYIAIISQLLTNAPTATIVKNTLGGTPVWSRAGAGNYVLTLAGAFTAGKSVMFTSNGQGAGRIINQTFPDVNRANITVANSSNVFTDSILILGMIKIEVYP